MQKVRWGVLGAAHIAERAAIPGIQASATGIVAAVASRREDQARAMAERFAIPAWYGDYDALLASPDIDAVYIALPNHLHAPWTIRAAQRGKHVLCEKPAALNAGQAAEMVAAGRTFGVQFAEAFMYRHHPRYRTIRAILERGEIGAVRAIDASFTFNISDAPTNVRFDRSMGGGGLYDVGCYPVSAARLILGREPIAATVVAQCSPRHGGVDMMASGLLEFPEGVALTFRCGMWTYGHQSLEILGERGRISVPTPFLGPPDFTVEAGGRTRSETFPDLNPYSLEADDIGYAILTGAPLAFAPEDAIRNMAALDACLASAEQGERVRVHAAP